MQLHSDHVPSGNVRERGCCVRYLPRGHLERSKWEHVARGMRQLCRRKVQLGGGPNVRIHPVNVPRWLLLGSPRFLLALPHGVLEFLRRPLVHLV